MWSNLGIYAAMKRFGFNAEDGGDGMVMVGDHHVDILAGKIAGLTTVGMTHGFGSEASLIDAGATVICHNLAQLKSQLRI